MTFLKKIKGGVYNGIGFVLVLGLTGIAYGAYVAMTDVTTGQPLTASTFNIVQENIRTLKTTVDGLSAGTNPVGAVMAFNLTTCPSGWIQANGANGTPDLRGQFIRGINTFDGGSTSRVDGNQDPDGTRAIRSYQADEFKSHNHELSGMSYSYVSAGGLGSLIQYSGATPVGYRGGNETRSKNVGLIYCVKQ